MSISWMNYCRVICYSAFHNNNKGNLFQLIHSIARLKHDGEAMYYVTKLPFSNMSLKYLLQRIESIKGLQDWQCAGSLFGLIMSIKRLPYYKGNSWNKKLWHSVQSMFCLSLGEAHSRITCVEGEVNSR